MSIDVPASAVRSRARPVRLLAAVVVAAAVAAAAVVGAVRYGRGAAVAEIGQRAAATLPLAAATLSGEIARQRLLPAVLARDVEVRALLDAPSDTAARAMGAKLRALAGEAGSSVLYVIDRTGIAVAASNDDTAESFVGSDYRFRAYVADAMATGAGFQYALGTVSRRPGLYLSRRVDGPAGVLGVVVVKVEFDRVETRWRQSGADVLVADDHGVVLATTRPAWRFREATPLADDVRDGLAVALGTAPAGPLPIERRDDGLALVDGADGRPHPFALAEGPVDALAPGWRMTVLLPAEGALDRWVRTAVLAAVLALLLVAGGGAWILARIGRARRRQASLAADKAELERRVADRTRDLSRANAALAGEIGVRAAAEERVRSLRDELAQANRLSILGQIAAGVAHEINQPVAAIRAHADNAARHLEAARTEKVSDTLRTVARLADRIGEITEHLKGFARRAGQPAAPVPLAEAVDGALALLAGRIRASGATVAVEGETPSPVVLAQRIRLEQILVNLLQNALDALAGRPAGRVVVSVAREAGAIVVRVADDGPGIDPAVAETLFMPFVTTRATGLGLGLVISAEIARDLGGTLRLERTASAGSVFRLDLPPHPATP